MKKKLFGLLACVMMFTLAFGIVACGETPIEPETYTVTFVNGEQTVKTSSVEKGEALTASDFPQDPTPAANKQFDGWYVGEEKLSVGFVPEADITANAKFSDIGGGEPAEYTVTFVAGEDTVKTVTITEGGELAAADFPIDPTAPANQKFVGWFIGETQVEAGYKPTASVTVTAKFVEVCTLTFVVEGEAEPTTVQVVKGEKPVADDLPGDPSKEHYSFDGWFDAQDNEFVETDTVEASATYTAKFTKVDYIVTFEQEGEEDKTVWVVKGTSTSQLSATDIPEPEEAADAFFLGWFNGDVKAAAGVEITADTTFTAQFFTKAEYNGVWYDDDTQCLIEFTQDGGVKCNKVDSTISNVTFSTEDGTLSGSTSDRFAHNFTFAIDESTMTVTETYYDAMEEDNVTNTYTLTKAVEDFALAGTYHNAKGSTNYLEITDGGFVTHIATSTIYYGRVVAENDGYKIILRESKDDEEAVEFTLTVDAKGNLVITGEAAEESQRGIYIEGSSVGQQFGCGETYLYVHTVDTETIYVYSDKEADTHYYVTVEGTLEDGEIVTLTKEDETSVKHLIKIVGTYQFVFPSAERGTYTLEEADDLYLDGFGTATVGEGDPAEYYIVGNKVVSGGNGYEIDTEGGTYTVLEKETADYVGKVFANFDAKTYTVVFDGFGIVVEECGINGTYYGTYTVEGTTLTTVMEDPDSVSKIESCTYTFKESNKILCNEDESVIYTREDYALYSKLNDFVGANEGYWVKDNGNGEYIEIVIEDNAITKFDYNGTEIKYYCNIRYDGAEITITYPDRVKFTVEEDGKIHVVSTDEDGLNDTYTSTAKPVTEKNAFDGGWTEADASYNARTFWFDSYSKGILINGSSMTKFDYKVKDGVASLSADGMDYTLTIEDDGSITAEWNDGEYTGTIKFNKGTPDQFVGVWTSDTVDYILTFTGYGYVHVEYSTYYNEYVKYTVSENVVTFEAYYDEWTCTLQADGNTFAVSTVDSDRYADFNATFTREATGGEVEADIFAGGWTGTVFSGTSTFWFDGFGKGLKITGNSKDKFDYTVTDKVATFSIGDYEYEFTMSGNSISATWCQEYEEPVPFTLEKGTPDKFAGVWTTEDADCTLTFTGYGFVHVVYSTYFDDYVKYTVDGDKATFEAYSDEWTCILQPDGTMKETSFDSDGYTGSVNGTFTREGGSEQEEGGDLDAFAGTWKDELGHVYVFDGKDTVTFDGSEYTYTVDGDGKAKFNNGTYDLTCTITDSTTMSVYFDDGGDDMYTKTATKQGGGEQLDALAGTWTLGDWSLTFDGKGKVTVNSGSSSETVDYEFDGTDLSFTFEYEDWTGTYQDEKLTISDSYGDYFTDSEFTKQ